MRARSTVALLAAASVAVLVAAWWWRPTEQPDLTARPADTAPVGGDPVPSQVDAREWQIHSFDGRPVSGGFGNAAWFRFSNDAPVDAQPFEVPAGAELLDGFNNCNRYSGSVRFDGDHITQVTPGMSTAMACPPPQFIPVTGELAIEQEWLVIRGDNTLVAFDRADGVPASAPPRVMEVDVAMPPRPVSTVAVSTAQPMPPGWPDLEGSRWVLTSVNGEPWTSSLVPSLTIGADTIFSGHDGCRRYVGAWWLSDPSVDRLVVHASEPEETVPCRAAVEPLLRPAQSFRFEVGPDRLVSGPLADTNAAPLPTPTLADGSPPPPPSTEPHVVFEPLAPGQAVRESHQLVGQWATRDGISVDVNADGTIDVGDCGTVASWRFNSQLEIDRQWPQYNNCPAAQSTSMSMLLLDTRIPESLERLDDGRLIHTSDTAITILEPVT